MKRAIVFVVFLLIIGNAVSASAVPMKLSATYYSHGLVDGVWHESFPLTYNAYYDSDLVTTSLYAPVEINGTFLQGYIQSVSIDYWDMLYHDEIITKKSGGYINFDYSDPLSLNLFYANEGITTAEMPWDHILDLRSLSSASIGLDLLTWAPGTTIGDIEGLSGSGSMTISYVPEPSAIFLLIGAVVGLMTRLKPQ